MSIMSDLNFITSTKQSLWNVIKTERAKAGPPTLELTTCEGLCSDEARKHIRLGPAGWTMIEGKKKFGTLGTLIVHCPYCGRKLK